MRTRREDAPNESLWMDSRDDAADAIVDIARKALEGKAG